MKHAIAYIYQDRNLVGGDTLFTTWKARCTCGWQEGASDQLGVRRRFALHSEFPHKH